MLREIEKSPISGWLALPFHLLALPVFILFLVGSIHRVAQGAEGSGGDVAGGVLGIVIGSLAILAWLFNLGNYFSPGCPPMSRSARCAASRAYAGRLRSRPRAGRT